MTTVFNGVVINVRCPRKLIILLTIAAPEQIESLYWVFEANARMVHAYVSGDNKDSSSDPDKFATMMKGVYKHCPT